MISRFENKHGQKTLVTPGADRTNFISHQKIKLGASAQNVRVWGDIGTLSSDDRAIALHTAWAEAILSDKVSIVFGRQEIVYDDHRIFGNVGWMQ
jgi:hypothetical protein